MDQMSENQIEQHVTVLGWLHLVGGALFVVVGLFVFFLLTGIGVAVSVEDPTAPRVLTIVGTAVGIFLAALGLPGILAGYGLLKKISWARPLAIVVGVLSLVNFPIGTAIGIYTMYVLLQDKAPNVFATGVLKSA